MPWRSNSFEIFTKKYYLRKPAKDRSKTKPRLKIEGLVKSRKFVHFVSIMEPALTFYDVLPQSEMDFQAA